MRFALALILMCVVATLAGADQGQQRPQQAQAEPESTLANIWQGFATRIERVTSDVKTELDKIGFEDAEDWLAQAGDDITSLSNSAVEHIKRELDTFAGSEAGEWLQEASGKFTEWTGHAATGLVSQLDKIDFEQADRWLAQVGMDSDLKGTWDDVRAMKLEDIPEHVKRYIRENPKQTTFFVINGIVFFSPGIVASPVLYLLGFKGSIAPRSAASLWQSTMGHQIARKSLFAHLQSAGGGGYGVSAVNVILRGLSGASHIADQAIKHLREGKHSKTTENMEDGHAANVGPDRRADEL